MSNKREMLSPQWRDQQQLILEYAAKACGLFDRGEWFDTTDGPVFVVGNNPFDPKDNSADCAAMCAKLRIETLWSDLLDFVECSYDDVFYQAFNKYHNNDSEAAWRFAATMIAAKIGGMK